VAPAPARSSICGNRSRAAHLTADTDARVTAAATPVQAMAAAATPVQVMAAATRARARARRVDTAEEAEATHPVVEAMRAAEAADTPEAEGIAGAVAIAKS
jgi:hypothetical protein